jgi:hypothetical protein
MTRKLPSTKSKRRLSPEERGRGFAKLAAEISAEVRAECGPQFFPGDYSEASISAFGVEMGQLFAKWEAEDAQRKKAERKPRKSHGPSISTMIKQAEKATGKPLASITMPDGTKMDFAKPESSEPEINPWLADIRNKETKQ